MQNSIIEDIFFNSVSLSERIELSKEYKKVSDKSYEIYTKLIGLLNDEQKKLLEDFADNEMGVCAEGEILYFKEGLKVGMMLASECFVKP